MKSFISLVLLETLKEDVRQLLLVATDLQKKEDWLLTRQTAPGKWSVAQILAHLNSYGGYYLPSIKKALSAERPATEIFHPGWLGNYFTKIMKPGVDGRIASKMNCPKNHQPADGTDVQPALAIFLQQQQELLQLLEEAKKKNISIIRVPVSISRIIRLKAGDTFRFLIAHEQRHFLQIKNTLAGLQETINKSPAVRQAVQP